MIENIENFNSGHFFIPVGTVTAELEVKKSIFVANLSKVNDKTDVIHFINKIKKKYSDAKHHSWGYIIGDPINPSMTGMIDDCEPRGSAGKPIINVLNQNSIGYALAVVTRYFGGVKLGIGGLIRAYSRVVGIALKNVSLQRFYVQEIVLVSVPYKYKSLFFHTAKKLGVVILNIRYGDLAVFKVSMNERILRNFVNSMKDISRGQIAVESNSDQFSRKCIK